MGESQSGRTWPGCGACAPAEPHAWPEAGVLVLTGITATSARRLGRAPFAVTSVNGPLLMAFAGDLCQHLDWLAANLSVAEQHTAQAAIGPKDTRSPEDVLHTMINLVPLTKLLARRHEDRLAQLLRPEALVSFLQPLVRVADGTIFGYEALVRSRQADELVFPGELWPLARATGHLARLECLARSAAIEAKVRHVPPGVKLFVNVPPSILLRGTACLEQTLFQAEARGVPLGDLVFELVETERVQEPAKLLRSLASFRERGIGLAIDDLGSGYSTMLLLAELHPDFVKVDRSLIQGVHQDPIKARIVSSIATLCRDLGIISIAEGVEEAEDYASVAAMGFPLVQGYFLGRPELTPLPMIPEAAVAPVQAAKAALARLRP